MAPGLWHNYNCSTKKRHQLWGAYIGYTPTEAFFLELPIPSYAAG
jgi:hypothetical protein